MEDNTDVKPAVEKKNQTLILVGFGVIVLLILLMLGGLYFSGRGYQLFQLSATPTVVRNTPTMIVLPTFTPTPTPAPIAYEELIPEGWIQFQSELVEIWLPSRFKSMDIKKFTADAEAQAARAGTKLGEEQGALELVLLDDSQRQSLMSIAVYISHAPLNSGSLDAYVSAYNADRPIAYRTVEHIKLRVGEYDAIRELVELSYQSRQINILVYVVQVGDTVWHIEYTCHITDFYEQLPDFQKSIQTFRPIQ